MPQFIFSTAMTANQLGLNPLSGWQYEYLPWPAQVILLVRATTVEPASPFIVEAKPSGNALLFRAAGPLALRRANSTPRLIAGLLLQVIASN